MKRYEVTVNGQVYLVTLRELSEAAAEQQAAAVEAAPKPVVSAPASAVANSEEQEVYAPMAGTILAVKVVAGQKVKQGETLLILEAMKMENEIVAPSDGIVQRLAVAAGEAVESSQLLLTI